MKMSDGEKVRVEVGGLRFEVNRREFHDDEGTSLDGGTTIGIFGEVEGEATQVLRFDCFRKDPHYHVPASEIEPRHLDADEIGDPLEWAYAQTREHLPDLIRQAGYAKLAESVDAQALRTGWEELRQAVTSAPAPTKTITLD